MRIAAALALLLCQIGLLSETWGSEPIAEHAGEPVYRQSKQLWAQSFLYAKAPDIVVEQWLGDEPKLDGKFILVEFWATWCSACRKAQPLLNSLQRTFGDELVIIGISDEPQEKVLPYLEENEIGYPVALDQQARMKDQLGVWGIPHVIIIEPGGYVIWEGYPLLEGFELTETIVSRILEIGRR